MAVNLHSPDLVVAFHEDGSVTKMTPTEFQCREAWKRAWSDWVVTKSFNLVRDAGAARAAPRRS